MKGIDIFDKIVIDGQEVDIKTIDDNNGKYFLTAGEHTVNYFFKNKSVIPANLFNGIEEITNVSIPSTVSEIGDNAFSGTNLSEEAISYIVKINENAFVPVEPELVKVDLGLKFSADGVEFVEGTDNDKIVEPVLSATDVDITGFEFTYSSSNPDVVTVDADGQLTIHKVGSSTITVEFKGNENYNPDSASYSVTIVEKEVEKQDIVMSLDQTEVTYQLGEENPVEPVLSISVDDLPLTYESGDENVATVDENGQLTLLSVGVATITISFVGNDEYNPAYVSYRLFVKTDVEMSFAEKTIECFDDEDVVFPKLTTSVQGLNISYSSSDDQVLSISQDENGVISTEIHHAGEVTVTAKFDGNDIYNEASCEFKVVIKHHVTMSFGDNKEIQLIEGQEQEPVSPVLTISDQDLVVEYSSSDTDVVTVDANGKLTIVNHGHAKITATYAGNSINSSAEASYMVNVMVEVTMGFEPTGIQLRLDAVVINEPTLTISNPELPVVYSSSNEEVATVDADGKLTLVGVGTCNITARFTPAENDVYLDASASYSVVVDEALGVEGNNDELNTLFATALSENQTVVETQYPVSVVSVPGTTKALTVNAPLEDGSTINLTSNKYIYLNNTSEETTNVTIAAPTTTTEEKVGSATSVYIGGNYDTVTIDNASLSYNTKVDSSVKNVVITDTTDTNVTVAAKFANGEEANSVSTNAETNITITPKNDYEEYRPSLDLNTPNASVTLNGKYNNVNATVSENTLKINGSASIENLTIQQGRVLVSVPSKDEIKNIVKNYESLSAKDKEKVDYMKLDVTNENSAKLVSTNELTFVEDITRTSSLTCGIVSTDNMIWKLNGHSLTVGEGNRTGIVFLRGSAKLRVEGDGEIRNETGYGLWLSGVNTHAIIDGGRWYAQTHVLYAENGTIEVRGGEFHCVNTEDPKFLLNCLDKNYTAGTAKIIVSGGKFYGFDPAASMGEPGGPVSFLAEGYKSVKLDEQEVNDKGVMLDVYEVIQSDDATIEPSGGEDNDGQGNLDENA